MYIYIRVYVYIYTYTNIYICTYVYIYTYTYVQLHVSINTQRKYISFPPKNSHFDVSVGKKKPAQVAPREGIARLIDIQIVEMMFKRTFLGNGDNRRKAQYPIWTCQQQIFNDFFHKTPEFLFFDTRLRKNVHILIYIYVYMGSTPCLNLLPKAHGFVEKLIFTHTCIIDMYICVCVYFFINMHMYTLEMSYTWYAYGVQI